VISFFDPMFQIEQARTEDAFGIVDGDEQHPAYTTLENSVEWTAQVENLHKEVALFIPVDKNMPLHSPDGRQLKTCDGMLTLPNKKQDLLIFLELKTGKTRNRKNWINHGIEQLESTIAEFRRYHDDAMRADKRAYVCNGKRPMQREFSQERAQRFFDNTGFRLYIDHVVRIVSRNVPSQMS